MENRNFYVISLFYLLLDYFGVMREESLSVGKAAKFMTMQLKVQNLCTKVSSRSVWSLMFCIPTKKILQIKTKCRKASYVTKIKIKTRLLKKVLVVQGCVLGCALAHSGSAAWRGLAPLALSGPLQGVGALGSLGPGLSLLWLSRLLVEPAGSSSLLPTVASG